MLAQWVAFGAGAVLMEGAAGTKKRAASFRVACFFGWLVLLPVSFVVAIRYGWEDVTAGAVLGALVSLLLNLLAWLWNVGRAALRRAHGGEAPTGEESKPVGSAQVMWPFVLVLLLVWLVLPAKTEKPAAVEPHAAVVAPVEAAVAEDREAGKRRREAAEDDCPCGAGHFCQGPRGGIYCWTAGGRKQYTSRQK